MNFVLDNITIGTLESGSIAEIWFFGYRPPSIHLGNWYLKREIFHKSIPLIDALVNILTEESIHCAIHCALNPLISKQFDNLSLKWRNAICFNEWLDD